MPESTTVKNNDARPLTTKIGYSLKTKPESPCYAQPKAPLFQH